MFIFSPVKDQLECEELTDVSQEQSIIRLNMIYLSSKAAEINTLQRLR